MENCCKFLILQVTFNQEIRFFINVMYKSMFLNHVFIRINQFIRRRFRINFE